MTLAIGLMWVAVIVMGFVFVCFQVVDYVPSICGVVVGGRSDRQPTQSANIAHSPTQGDRELEDEILRIIDYSNLAHSAYEYLDIQSGHAGEGSIAQEKTDKQMRDLEKCLLLLFRTNRKEWAKGLVPRKLNEGEQGVVLWRSNGYGNLNFHKGFNDCRSKILQAIEGGE